MSNNYVNKTNLVFFIFTAIYLFLLHFTSSYFQEDAMIYARIFENVSSGHGITFNVDESYASTTSILWSVLVTSSMYVFNIPALTALYLLSLFFCLAMLLCLFTSFGKKTYFIALLPVVGL